MSSLVCRACLTAKGKLRSIFTIEKISGKQAVLSDLLKSCTSVQVSKDDGLPDQICTECVLQVSKAFNFKEQCIHSDIILRQSLDKGKQSDMFREVEPGECFVYKAELIEEIIIPDITIPVQVEAPNTIDKPRDTDEHDNAVYDSSCVEQDDVKLPIIVKVRKRQSKIKKPSGPYVCKKCDKKLATYPSLMRHMQLHSDGTPFLCSECGASFKTVCAYRGHMFTHSSNPHKCNTCGKSYQQAASLRNHIMTHTGERPFLCMLCGKSCIQKSGFKKHMLTHTDEKPCVCNVCGKKFRFSCNLKRHIRMHTGEKPFICQRCDRRFASTAELKRHSIIHTGERPYTCEYCGKDFAQTSALRTHLKLHTGKRDHVCKICGKGFIQAHCLHSHMLKYHDK